MGRFNLLELAFLSIFGEFPWFYNVGGTHFDDTGTEGHEMYRNGVCQNTLKAHFKCGSCTVILEIFVSDQF